MPLSATRFISYGMECRVCVFRIIRLPELRAQIQANSGAPQSLLCLFVEAFTFPSIPMPQSAAWIMLTSFPPSPATTEKSFRYFSPSARSVKATDFSRCFSVGSECHLVDISGNTRVCCTEHIHSVLECSLGVTGYLLNLSKGLFYTFSDRHFSTIDFPRPCVDWNQQFSRLITLPPPVSVTTRLWHRFCWLCAAGGV